MQDYGECECVQLSCDRKHKNTTKNNTLFCRQSRRPTTYTLKNMEEALKKINSEADFRTFLDEYVHWNVSFSKINQSIEKSYDCSKSATNSNLQQFYECYKSMDRFPNCSNNQTPGKEERKFLNKISSVFMISGVISLIGNITVIFIEVRALIRKRSVAEEKTVYRILILNLSISDLLMGFYITFFPITLQFDELPEFNKIPELCNFFGVISVLSSEVSVTVLVLICFYRWIGIVYPFKTIRLKVLKTIIVVMWIVWLIIALLPALSVDLIGFFFIDGIQLSNKSKPHIIFHRVLKLFEHIFSGANKNTLGHVIPAFRKLVDFNSSDLLQTFLNHLGILKNNDFNYLGYYSYDNSCTLRTFITTSFSHQYYTLCILFYNFLAFTFISIACIVISKQLARNEKSVEQNGLSVNEQKLIENKKIYRRLLFVVITDCLCWIPICVIAFSIYFKNLYQSKGKRDCSTKSIQLALTGIVLVLMPINSIINPYLYSWHIWKKLLKKCKTFFVRN